MGNPTVSVINFTTDLVDRDVQTAIRAVNRQIVEDFAPIWGAAWELVLHASPADPTNTDALEEESVRGEGVLYLVDESTLPGALGFHALNTSEMPFGFVFNIDPDEWTVTLSHEALEMIIDSTANVLVPGPDPRNPENFVLHAYEVCDAVERTSYFIDNVRVSNFITPSWFFPGDAASTRNDFLGVGVASFGATPGSHLAFLDLDTGWQNFIAPQARMNRRFEQYSFDRKRPDQKALESVLNRCKENPPKALANRVAGGLKGLDALTRSDRHQQAALRLGKHTAR